MSYDFETPVNRRGTNSLKWDVKENELPMWVADMDLMTAPEITEALTARAAHGIFGYSVIPDEWYDAYIDRWREYHGLVMRRGELCFCSGVIPAISSIIRRLTCPAENVVIMTPVYNIFFNCILNNGRNALESPLIYDGKSYFADLEDLEKKLALPQTTLLLLCNPHNPVGKIWDAQTLQKIGEMCEKHGVTVLSDEIHCDITDPGKDYVPFASASELCRRISVTCISPTKAFNLAGIQTSAVFVSNDAMRRRIWRGLNNDEIAEPNAFAVQAAVAAFKYGGDWLDELREHIYRNKNKAFAFIVSKLPQIKPVSSEATYLLWLDCRDIERDGGELAEYIRKSTGLYLSDGKAYGRGGHGFLRMNIACPSSTLADGLNRLLDGVESYLEHTKD